MCDTVVVVRSDGVLFAKNSDRDPNEAQHLDWQPRREHQPGARIRCTYIDIPQASSTNAVLLSRPYWMWGAEMGVNEHGVAIGNEAVFTDQPLEPVGLTGMDLLRLALERAADAAEAVDVITTLLAEHGQGGGCGLENPRFSYHNSFLIADPTRAFVLETAGRLHAVEEVRGARSISNGLTIPGFAEAHSDRVRSGVAACAVRQARTQALAESADDLPALAALLRDHGAGHRWPHYSWLNGGMSAPCMHAGGLLAASQTTASWLSHLRPHGASQHWVTATAAPCLSLFKPVRVDEPLAWAARPAERADRDSLWWRHERLHRLVMRDPQRLGAIFLPERDEVERGWFASPPEPCDAFAEGDRLLAQWTRAVESSGPIRDLRPHPVRRYWQKRNAWARLTWPGDAPRRFYSLPRGV